MRIEFEGRLFETNLNILKQIPKNGMFFLTSISDRFWRRLGIDFGAQKPRFSVLSGKVRSGQARSGQVRSGQVRSVQIRSGQSKYIAGAPDPSGEGGGDPSYKDGSALEYPSFSNDGKALLRRSWASPGHF